MDARHKSVFNFFPSILEVLNGKNEENEKNDISDGKLVLPNNLKPFAIQLAGHVFNFKGNSQLGEFIF